MEDQYQKTVDWLNKCKTNYGSKYNSGWDNLHWKNEIEKTEARLASWGKQLKIKFPAE